jgi:hypothetical protein
LIVLPAGDSSGNIRILRPLIASTQQQHDRLPCLRVVDSLAGTDVNPQFPHPLSTEAMIAEVSHRYPIDTA